MTVEGDTKVRVMFPEEPGSEGGPGDDSSDRTAVSEGRTRKSSLADSGEGLTVNVLREILRSYLLWRAVYESDGIEVINLPDGSEVSIHDIEYLLLLSREIPVRHRQAIYLCLVYNKSEEDAARALNLDETNPVAMYATMGLHEILSMVNLGLAPSRRKVYAKDAVMKNRATMAEVEETVDFGPGVYPVTYEYYEGC